MFTFNLRVHLEPLKGEIFNYSFMDLLRNPIDNKMISTEEECDDEIITTWEVIKHFEKLRLQVNP